MTASILTLSIKTFGIIKIKCDTKHKLNSVHNHVMMSVIYAECHKLALYAELQYTECHYDECQYYECLYAKRQYAECQYAECSAC